MIHFWSDPHFGHYNIISYSKRPFGSLDEMHAAIIARHNAVVGPEDVSVCVGDFGFGAPGWLRAIAAQLSGKTKILVRGNHDGSVRRANMLGFDVVLEGMELVLPGGKRAMVAHKPRHADHPLIHGHTHSSAMLSDYGVCVCVEAISYTPVDAEHLSLLLRRG